jgi:Flp pilus assembly protein TadD
VTAPNADLIAGRRFYAVGNWELADRHLRAGLAADPTSADDHARLAGTFVKRRRLWDARQESNEALRLNPHSPVVLGIRIDVLLAVGDPEGAVRIASELVKTFPASAPAHGRLAFALVQAKRPRAALVAAEEGLRLNASDVEALNVRALALVELGRTNEGEAVLRDALRMQPNDPALQNNIGLIQMRQGQPLAARDSFHEALRIEPEQLTAHRNLAFMRFGIVPFINRIVSSLARGKRRIGSIPLPFLAAGYLLLLAAAFVWPWAAGAALVAAILAIGALIRAASSIPPFDRLAIAAERIRVFRYSSGSIAFILAYRVAGAAGPAVVSGAILALAVPIIVGAEETIDVLVAGPLLAAGLGVLVARSGAPSGLSGQDAVLVIGMFILAALAPVVSATIRTQWAYSRRRA